MPDKRDLIYLWINEGDDGIFKDQSINFGSEYVFKVERKNERLMLSAEKDGSYIPDFFSPIEATGSVSNLTAFVGKNGTGKTKLCKLIANIIDGWTDCEYVSVVRVTAGAGTVSYEAYHSHSGGEGESPISAFRRGAEEPEPPPPSILDFDKNLNHFTLALTCDLGKARAVYYSPITDFSNTDFRRTYPHYVDVSSNNLLLSALQNEIGSWTDFDEGSVLDIVRAEAFNRHFQLVYRSVADAEMDALPDIDLHLDALFIRLVPRKHDLLKDTWNIPVVYTDEIADLKEKYDTDMKALSGRYGSAGRDEEKVAEVRKDHVVLAFAYNMLLSFLHNLDKDNTFLSSENPISHSSEAAFVASLKEFFNNIQVTDGTIFTGAIEHIEQYKDSIQTPEWSNEVERFQMEPEAARALFSYNLNIERALSKLHHRDDEDRGQGFLKFEWGINPSSGEKTYIDLWSSIWRAREILGQRKNARQIARTEDWWPDDVYLILDEGDLGFHPAWQQQYVRSLIRVTPHFFEQAGANVGPGMTELLGTRIHIIIATHSPISLSDVPRSHAVFLQKRKSGTMTERWVAQLPEVTIDNTFGANIHDLYRNPFFLSDHTVGHFAFDKIDWVVKELNRPIDDVGDRGMLLRIISLIGEPVIRQRLIQMYEERYGQAITNDDRIRYHEEQLKRLRGEVK